MQEALSASVAGTAATSPEDLLEIAQTVARVMAEAGASPENIAKVSFMVYVRDLRSLLRAGCYRNQNMDHEAPSRKNDLRGLSWCI